MILTKSTRMWQTLGGLRQLGTGRMSLLVMLTGGHTAIHWFQQLFPVILPEIKTDFRLTDLQVGSLATAREAVSGALALPSGVLADTCRRQMALILAASLACSGLAYWFVGVASAYRWVIAAMALVGVATALWHPAANASLSMRLPERRGTALAVHGVGASIGDTVGPLTVGALLLLLSWRPLLQLHLIPALILTVILWRGLGAVYSQEGPRPSFHAYCKDVKLLLGQPNVIAYIISSGLMGMGRLSALTFLPIYLREQLGYSAFLLGFHVMLLYVMGMVSQPLMGLLSDRFGRRAVLVPGMACLGLLYFALALAGSGLQLGLVIAAMGLFFYGLGNITMAGVMDVAGAGVQGTSWGLMSVLSHLLSIPSPMIAGFLVSEFGVKSAFLYASAISVLAAVVLLRIGAHRPSVPPVSKV
ncbi:MAG TPA: MFS transporter [Alphaproteobacteria bacterium]|nr:MFS transporter [Alphaproteobacteria bacterium]